MSVTVEHLRQWLSEFRSDLNVGIGDGGLELIITDAADHRESYDEIGGIDVAESDDDAFDEFSETDREA